MGFIEFIFGILTLAMAASVVKDVVADRREERQFQRDRLKAPTRKPAPSPRADDTP